MPQSTYAPGRIRSLIVYAVKTIIVVAVYLLAARFGLSLSVSVKQTSTVWPPTGIALALLFVLGPRYWPAIFIGALIANAHASEPIWVASIIAGGNTLEAVTGVLLLRRVGFRSFDRLIDVFLFLSCAVIASTLVSAVIGTLALCLGGIVPWSDFVGNALVWWVGDGMGNVVFASLLIVWISQSWRSISYPRYARIIALFAASCVALAELFLIAHAGVPTLYFVFPVIIIAALIEGQFGAVTMAFVIYGFVVWGTVLGTSPLSHIGPEHGLLPSMLFIFFVAMTGQILGAAITERDAVLEELQERKKTLEDDVRQRTALLEDALEDNAKFKQAVHASTDAIVITSADTEILYVNPAWEAQTGYAAREVLGKTTSILKSDRSDESVLGTIRAAIRDGAIFHSEEIVNRRKDGTTYNVELAVYPVREGPQLRFFVGVHRDITRRKRADSVKTSFISLASHELRSPLTAVRWILSRLRNEQSIPPKERSLIELAHHSAVQMASIIETMLTIAEVDEGSAAAHVTAVDVPSLLAEIVRDLDPMVRSKRLMLEVDCPPLTLATDEQFLREIFTNLLHNACKYTPDDGKISVTARERDGKAQVVISDTGCGIPQSQQDRVFTKFFRADNVASADTAGTGLGLYLVYALVQILGGEVSFVSRENHGTTFTLTFPSLPFHDPREKARPDR